MNPTHVEPGARLPIVASFYTGRAGVVPSQGGGQLACKTAMPPETADRSLKIDGRTATITSIRPSSSDGRFIVARFVWAEENEQ